MQYYEIYEVFIYYLCGFFKKRETSQFKKKITVVFHAAVIPK